MPIIYPTTIDNHDNNKIVSPTSVLYINNQIVQSNLGPSSVSVGQKLIWAHHFLQSDNREKEKLGSGNQLQSDYHGARQQHKLSLNEGEAHMPSVQNIGSATLRNITVNIKQQNLIPSSNTAKSKRKRTSKYLSSNAAAAAKETVSLWERVAKHMERKRIQNNQPQDESLAMEEIVVPLTTAEIISPDLVFVAPRTTNFGQERKTLSAGGKRLKDSGFIIDDNGELSNFRAGFYDSKARGRDREGRVLEQMPGLCVGISPLSRPASSKWGTRATTPVSLPELPLSKNNRVAKKSPIFKIDGDFLEEFTETTGISKLSFREFLTPNEHVSFIRGAYVRPADPLASRKPVHKKSISEDHPAENKERQLSQRYTRKVARLLLDDEPLSTGSPTRSRSFSHQQSYPDTSYDVQHIRENPIAVLTFRLPEGLQLFPEEKEHPDEDTYAGWGEGEDNALEIISSTNDLEGFAKRTSSFAAMPSMGGPAARREPNRTKKRLQQQQIFRDEGDGEDESEWETLVKDAQPKPQVEAESKSQSDFPTLEKFKPSGIPSFSDPPSLSSRVGLSTFKNTKSVGIPFVLASTNSSGRSHLSALKKSQPSEISSASGFLKANSHDELSTNKNLRLSEVSPSKTGGSHGDLSMLKKTKAGGASSLSDCSRSNGSEDLAKLKKSKPARISSFSPASSPLIPKSARVRPSNDPMTVPFLPIISQLKHKSKAVFISTDKINSPKQRPFTALKSKSMGLTSTTKAVSLSSPSLNSRFAAIISTIPLTILPNLVGYIDATCDLHAAATVVQKILRGHFARRRYTISVFSVIALQRWWRIRMVVKRYRQFLEEKTISSHPDLAEARIHLFDLSEASTASQTSPTARHFSGKENSAHRSIQKFPSQH